MQDHEGMPDEEKALLKIARRIRAQEDTRTRLEEQERESGSRAGTSGSSSGGVDLPIPTAAAAAAGTRMAAVGVLERSSEAKDDGPGGHDGQLLQAELTVLDTLLGTHTQPPTATARQQAGVTFALHLDSDIQAWRVQRKLLPLVRLMPPSAGDAARREAVGPGLDYASPSELTAQEHGFFRKEQTCLRPVSHERRSKQYNQVNPSCCPLRPRTTPFPEEKAVLGVTYGV